MKLARRDLILLGFVIYFTFIGGTFYSQLNFVLRVAHQVIVTVVLGGWLVIKLSNRQGLPKTALDWPIAVYLLANLISAVFGLLPRYSLELMWFSVTHVLAFYLLVDLMRRGQTAKVVWAFYMTAAVVCLVGLAEFLAWYFGTPLFAAFSQGWAAIGGWRHPLPPQIYRLNITLNGSTPLAAYLALLIPPAVGLILTLPRRSENRRALLIWVGLAFVVEILTFSRAGVLAMLVSLPLLLATWRWLRSEEPFRLRAEIGALLKKPKMILLLIIIAGLGSGWLYRSFSDREYSTNFRFTLWEAARQIFQQHWLTGAGPANFGRAVLRLNNPDFPRQQISTAHSIYFNTAAELGLLGLLVGAALLLTVVWLGWQRWRQASTGADKIRVTAVGAALAGLAGQTMVDTYMATPNMLPMLALVAWLAAGQNHRFRWPGLAYLSLVILLGYAGWFANLARADFYFQRSFNREQAGNLAEAAVEATKAWQIDPAFPLRTFRLARLEAIIAHQNNDDATLVQAAIVHYRYGLQQEPIWGLNSASLAGLLWQAGQTAEAATTLEQTIAIEPDPLYLINLGYFYEQQNNWPAAETAYGRALAQKPQWAGSGFWQADESRTAHWPEIERAAQTAADSTRTQWLRDNLALAQADFARILAESADPALRARAWLALEQPDKAAALLTDSPQSSEDYLLLWGWLKLQQGDDEAAATLLKTAIFLGNGEAYYFLGQLYEQQGNLPAAEMAYRRGFAPRAVSENIAVNIYDRRSGNDLVPQLLKISGGEPQAKAWLALARLYQQQQRLDEAEQLYRFLRAEDPFSNFNFQ